MYKIVYRSISFIVSITLILGSYFSAGASSASVSSPYKTMSKGVSVLAAAAPDVGGHIHVEIANHPADGFPIPRKPYTFHVVLKAHNNTGKITSFYVQDESTAKEKISVSLGPCVDCSVAFDFTVDFSKWSAGRHELRWHASEPDQDAELAGSQRQFTTSRSQVCLESCSPNVSGRATPFQGAGSWYQDHDYATVYLLSNEINVKPGGSIIVRAAQSATGACVFLNPDFHNLSSGTTLGCWSDKNNHTINIPSNAKVGDKLVLYASDGFNAGIFRINLGDGTPRSILLYEYQSWWAKTGMVLPTNGATVPTSTATPIILPSGTSTATGTPTRTATPTVTPIIPPSGTPTVTATPTWTATPTATIIPPTPTPTSTRTPTQTATPTATPIILPSGNTIHFAVVGDYGSGSTNETNVANLIKSWSPDLIITTGDNNYESGAASTIDPHIGKDYHDYIGNYTGTYGAGSTANRFFPSLGNHDWSTSGALPYINFFTLPGNERYYDFVKGNVHFYVVDSDSHEPDGVTATSTQALWLKNKLAASTSKWDVVYFHHPPYSSGSNHGSTVGMRWPFKLWGAEVVLSGHDHTYERLLIDGMPYFVNGAGGKSLYGFGTPITGSQVRYNAKYGAMMVDANNTTMTFKFINVDGVVIDNYSISTSLALSAPAIKPALTNTATGTARTVTPLMATPTASPMSVSPTVTQTSAPAATSVATLLPPTPTAPDSISPTFTPTATSVANKPPVITSKSSLSISENTTTVTTVTAADADLPAQTLTYSISGGADSTLFKINSSTGELTFITAPDFEAPTDAGIDNVYNVTVQASDGTLAAAQDIAVTVTAAR